MEQRLYISSYGEIPLIDYTDGNEKNILHPPGRYEFERVANPFGLSTPFLRLKGSKIGAPEEELRSLEYNPEKHKPEASNDWHEKVLLFCIRLEPGFESILGLEDEEHVLDYAHSLVDNILYFRIGYNNPRIVYYDAQGNVGLSSEPWEQIKERATLTPAHQP